MPITFRKAVRENVSLIIGMIGSSGSGKTYSALELAQGLAGSKPIVMLDTEAGRGLHYADRFTYDYAAINEPFRPATYTSAIAEADKAGYGVIIVDSASHVWSGPGGVLDWQEEELTRMAGDDYCKRESCKMSSWIKPKMAHKQMVQRLLQVHAHLIICLRAEEKMAMEKDDKGKLQVVQKGWQPICDKNLPYELTMSLLFTDAKPGLPNPIKLQEQHRNAFQPGALVGRQTGVALAEWAAGGVEKPRPAASGGAPINHDAIIKAFMEYGGREYIESYLGRPVEEMTGTDRDELKSELARLKKGA